MFHIIFIVVIAILANLYYCFTYTNRLVSEFYKIYTRDNEKVFVKKSTIKHQDEDVETELYVDTFTETETLLNISTGNNIPSTSNVIKGRYNSAEIMTLLWYANGELVRNGKCFNKDFIVLLVLAIIADLNREGIIGFAKYNDNSKPLILCMDKRSTGISYYDFCIDLFQEKNKIPLHVYINMAILKGLNLRNLVIEDLEKKELAQRITKDYFVGKLILNYWALHMPMECQRWFRDFVFRDFNDDSSIRTLIELMILSSEILYQKDRLFSNIFGKNEFYYIKKKFTEGIESPVIYVVNDNNISKDSKEFENLNNKPLDAETEITVGNDI